jgi:uncharacterized protein (DUF1501 family)
MLNIISRRSFLERSLQVALGAAASAYLGVPQCIREAVAAGTIPDGTKKLLFIFLRGGNDGLNTIVPWGDAAYNTTTRPTLYLPKPDPLTSVSGKAPTAPDLARAIDLGNGFAGMHPALVDLAPLFNDGQAALIHRVGYPRQSRSHFDSQKYWENGVPRDNLLSNGIFYRAVVNSGLYKGRQFPAVSVQSGSNPLLLRGPIAMTSLSDPTTYDMLGVAANGADRQKLLAAITGQHRIDHPEKDNRGLLFPTGATLEDSIDSLKALGLTRGNNDFFDQDGTTHLFPIDAASNQKGFNGSYAGFFNNIKVAAQILAGTDAVVAGTRLDGFDTHDNQGSLAGGHAARMQWIGWAMHALRRFFMDADPKLWENMVVVTLSEFGRTSKENGNQGTDHAEAGVMLVTGGKVKGGVYQCNNNSWTVGTSGSMFQVSGRYLRRSVDYRSVLGEIIRDHLGATPEQLNSIIPGYADPSENLRTGGISLDGTRIVGELGLI